MIEHFATAVLTAPPPGGGPTLLFVLALAISLAVELARMRGL